MTRLLWALAATSLLFLAGCSTHTTVLPPTPLKPFHATLRVLHLWSRTIGSGAGGQRYALVPSPHADAVLTASRGGRIAAYRATDGHELWSIRIDRTITAGPGAGDGQLFVTTRRATLVALNETDGHVAWRAKLPTFALTPPVVSGNRVIVETADGHLVAFRVATGQRLWTVAESMPHLILRGNSPPVVTRNRIYAGLNSGQVVALSLRSGRTIWDVTIAHPTGHSRVARMVDIVGPMALVHHHLFAVSDHGRLVCLSTRSGARVWSRKVSSLSGLAAGMENIYVTDASSIVRVYDRVTGLPIWVNPDFKGRRLTAPIPFGPAVVTGDLGGWIEFLSRSDGHLLARVRPGSSEIQIPPVVQAGRLFVLTSGGTLAAYRLPKG
ncbi:MAG: outer membrane protein assembly factor BamB [Gammaproteobacteria bacterium]